MIGPEIKAVLFDAVGTLLLPVQPPARTYAEVGRRHGSRLSEGRIGVRFREAFRAEEDADRAAGWRTSEERERRRWRAIVGRVLDDVGDPEACFEELFEHFARPHNWYCPEGTARVLEGPAGRGLVVGVGSNFDGRLERVVAGRPELARVGLVVISARVGWRKPAGVFFESMARAAGVGCGEVLYVGDDLGNDYEGAIQAGMAAVLVDPAGRAPGGVRRIGGLGELIGLQNSHR